MAWLEYAGRIRKLPDGIVILGSGPDAALQVDDADLMPRHVIIHPRDDGVEIAAFSPDVVVALGDHQIGTEAHRAAFGEPVRAGSAEFRVWREQPPQRAAVRAPAPIGYLIDEEERAAYPLDRRSTNIGRASANVIRLADPTASRYHAQVRREAGGFALHVVGSAGGTVNGRRVASPCLLQEGDVVELAYSAFSFSHGPLPPGIRILPTVAPGEVELTERPTITRDRISLSPTGPGARPRILGTAVVLGVLTALAAAVFWLVAR